jgi:hypothetical protein
MTYLLDTNVLAELRKLVPDRHVMSWYEGVEPSELYLSVLTVGELRAQMDRLRRKSPGEAARLEQWLVGLLATYQDRLVTVDAETAQQWGRFSALGPLPVIDGLLAATALVRGWTLVTRGPGRFSRTGVPLLDPFVPRPSRPSRLQ